MNLDYRIGWIEDQPNNVTGLKRNIQTYLSDNGFVPLVDFFSDWAAIEKLVKTNQLSEYDLFLVDWQLMAGHDGVEVSNEIRRHKVYAEIVFYSAAETANIRSAIHKAEIDGVFCAYRDRDLEEVAC